MVLARRLYEGNKAQYREWVTTTGTVVDVFRRETDEGHTRHVLITFTPITGGDPVELEAVDGFPLMGKMEGQTVRVRYDPQDHKNALEDRTFVLFEIPIVVAGFGVIFILAGVSVAVVAIKAIRGVIQI